MPLANGTPTAQWRTACVPPVARRTQPSGSKLELLTATHYRRASKACAFSRHTHALSTIGRRFRLKRYLFRGKHSNLGFLNNSFLLLVSHSHLIHSAVAPGLGRIPKCDLQTNFESLACYRGFIKHHALHRYPNSNNYASLTS